MDEKRMKIHVNFHSRSRSFSGQGKREIEIKKGANVRDLPRVLSINEEQSK